MHARASGPRAPRKQTEKQTKEKKMREADCRQPRGASGGRARTSDALGLLADGGLAYSPLGPSVSAIRRRGQAIAAPRPRLACMQQREDDAATTAAVGGMSTVADSYTRLLSVLAAGGARSSSPALGR